MNDKKMQVPGMRTVAVTSSLVAVASLVNLYFVGGRPVVTSTAWMVFALAAVNAIFAFNTWSSNRAR
ncbi:hypothetical protein [Leifsonia sp. EB34]|uniref:hypothetical protein n=1 Tax=Leifsonia sp. EB34 TaxID=3156303 RepID=UPI0035197615